MRITYDPAKRDLTLTMRGLDFKRAAEIFAGVHFTYADERRDYGETRNITVGRLDGRMVVTVWTPRGAGRHIISLRKANEKEQKYYRKELD